MRGSIFRSSVPGIFMVAIAKPMFAARRIRVSFTLAVLKFPNLERTPIPLDVLQNSAVRSRVKWVQATAQGSAPRLCGRCRL